MEFNLQPTLQNEFVRAEPLKATDFEKLYAVASDPLIWEQHPNKDRYKREVFETFFQGAMESGGAFLVYDNKSNQPIGSSRYYEFNAEKNSVAIGYTFFARDHWGSTYNMNNLDRFFLNGEKGFAELLPSTGYGPIKGRTMKGELTQPHATHQTVQMDEMADIILAGKKPIMPVDGMEGWKDMKIIDAIFVAAKSGKKVDIKW